MQDSIHEITITKIISTLSKSEKQLMKTINEIENIVESISNEEKNSIKLLSEKSLEILNHFNIVIMKTIFSFHKLTEKN